MTGPDLLQPRAVHRSTLLSDGRVLLTGGCTTAGCGGFDAGRRSELFDPSTATFADGPLMAQSRASHTATRTPDGRVLVIGGYPGEGEPPTATIEVFDPSSGAFGAFSALARARADHTATLLSDGKVLIAGGFGADGAALDSTEVVDPAAGSVDAGPRLGTARGGHVAVSTSAGVLVVGGTATGRALGTTELITADDSTPGPALGTARVKHAAVSLADGRVLVIGGASTTEGRRRLASTEFLSIAPLTSRPGPALSRGEYKLDGAVTTLPDGRVVIAGGELLEVFDPSTGALTLGAPLGTQRSFLTATAVGPDRVLVAGGYDAAIVPTRQAELIAVGAPARVSRGRTRCPRGRPSR